jgi:hypothetical protein
MTMQPTSSPAPQAPEQPPRPRAHTLASTGGRLAHRLHAGGIVVLPTLAVL